MSKRQMLMILGLWVMIILCFGFPKNWDKYIILPVTGLVIIFTAYRLKPEGSEKSAENKELPFVDYHSPANEKPADKVSGLSGTAS